MFRRTVQFEIGCAPEAAFNHIAVEFFDNHPRWDPGIVELSRTSEGPVALGTTGREVREVNGRRFTSAFRVTTFEPVRAFSHRGTEGAMGEDVDYLIEPAASGTRITFTVDIYPKTLLMRILTPMIRPQVERNFTSNVARFQQMLQALTPAAVA